MVRLVVKWLKALLRNSEFAKNRCQNSEQNSSVIPAIYQTIRL
ncbi:hypothetical protein [Vibrio vulnificus YJ016]|uniref:Uncharacterized protein n=1 Tax=Vibrio vulnificus (strain YJ016) TaxID=196600 RepID=Q7MJC8_VIBVY|nr:hypothetical protein [Vibrio vulnificus YJ016]